MRTVLPARPKLFVGGSLAAAAICCAVVILTSGRPKFELSVAQVVDVRETTILSSLDRRFPIDDTNDNWVVVMRVRNPSRQALWFGKEKVQPRLQGHWLKAESVAWLNSSYFVATVPGRSQQDFVVAVVPCRTEALRLVLEYLPEPSLNRVHNLVRYYASRDYVYGAQYTRFQKLRAWLLVSLDSWAIDPLRRWGLSRQWPSRTVEFRLPPDLPARPQRLDAEHNPLPAANTRRAFCFRPPGMICCSLASSKRYSPAAVAEGGRSVLP